MFDVNWLLSATAQSTAAIVAILGGFIATRLMTDSTKRKEIEAHIKDIDDEITFKKARATKLYGELLEDRAVDFIHDHSKQISRIYLGDETTTLETILDDEISDFVLSEIQPYWDETFSLLKLIISKLNGKKLGVYEKDVATILKKEITSFQYCICNDLFNNFMQVFEEKPREEAKHEEDKHLSIFGNLSSFKFPEMNTDIQRSILINSHYTNCTNTMAYQKKYDEHQKLLYELDLLALQKKNLSYRQTSLEKPNDVFIGLLVLTLFAVIGIVFPLCSMPVDTAEIMTPEIIWIANLDIMLFAIGLGLVIGYFVWFFMYKK